MSLPTPCSEYLIRTINGFLDAHPNIFGILAENAIYIAGILFRIDIVADSGSPCKQPQLFCTAHRSMVRSETCVQWTYPVLCAWWKRSFSHFCQCPGNLNTSPYTQLVISHHPRICENKISYWERECPVIVLTPEL